MAASALLAALPPLLAIAAYPVHAAFTAQTHNPANTFTADVLAAPTGLSVTRSCSGGAMGAVLSWTPTASTWADGYTWQRTSGGVTVGPTTVVGQASNGTVDAGPLTVATTYQYELRATAAQWRSAAAATAITPSACLAVAGATSTTTIAAANTISVPTPAGVTSGELLIAYVADAGTVPTVPDQAGWTAIRTDYSHNDWITQALWYRWAGAGEPASYTFTKSNPKADMFASMLRISGANATTPIDASAGDSQGGPASTTIVAPSVTTAAAGTLLLTFASTTDMNTYTPAAGMTEHVDANDGKWVSAQVASQHIAAAGATGTRTITISNEGNVYAVASTIALRG